MARKNKAKRRAKRLQARLRRKRRRTEKTNDEVTIPEGYSTPLLKTFGFGSPLAHLTEEQRSEFARSIGEKAAEEFDKRIDELKTVVREHDPLELLATSAFYCLYKGIGPGTDYTQEGPYTQAMVELLQSICLMHSIDEYEQMPVFHQFMFQAMDLCKECSGDYALKRMTSLAEAESRDGPGLLVIEEARMHTQAMRNWGYPQHMERIELELCAPLESDFQSAIGIGPVALHELTVAISQMNHDRVLGFINEIRPVFRETNLRKMVNQFCRITGQSEETAEEMHELIKSKPVPNENKRYGLISYLHQFLPDLFTFTLDDLTALSSIGLGPDDLEQVLDLLSLQFGDLSDENPEHLVLQSKIRTRPLIKLKEATYFLPIHGLLHSFFVDIVEAWTKPHADLKKRYHKRRSVYLESTLKALLDDAFPNCVVKTGTTWRDSESPKEYENDCLVVCGPLALVFEAKSESVDDVAKRGGSKTLADHYETLVSEPAEQAARLARLLEEGKSKREFQTKKHGEYELDLATIKRAVCVSVTLDWLPACSLCWRKLEENGLVHANSRPAINLSLADLMVVLEVLQSPATRVHYFWRRAEWESRVEYMADELDLLVYYLSEGLAIPRCEDGETHPLILYGNSDELHRRYMASWAEDEETPPLPRRILTDWWMAILERVESIDLHQSWDIACVLLDLDYRRQQEFEKRFEDVMKNVERDGNDCGTNGLITYADHTESVGAVVAFAYEGLDKEERDARAEDLAAKAQSDSGARRIVVIGRDVKRLGYPYDFLAYIDG